MRRRDVLNARLHKRGWRRERAVAVVARHQRALRLQQPLHCSVAQGKVAGRAHGAPEGSVARNVRVGAAPNPHKLNGRGAHARGAAGAQPLGRPAGRGRVVCLRSRRCARRLAASLRVRVRVHAQRLAQVPRGAVVGQRRGNGRGGVRGVGRGAAFGDGATPRVGHAPHRVAAAVGPHALVGRRLHHQRVARAADSGERGRGIAARNHHARCDTPRRRHGAPHRGRAAPQAHRHNVGDGRQAQPRRVADAARSRRRRRRRPAAGAAVAQHRVAGRGQRAPEGELRRRVVGTGAEERRATTAPVRADANLLGAPHQRVGGGGARRGARECCCCA